MENLKEEAENIKSGLSKTISDVSDIILERFKNPYITSFAISWAIVNWKPIAFFLFSKGNVEYKIKYITNHYSDWLICFILPLELTFFFLFIVPFLNQANEWFVKPSVTKRADNIRDRILLKIGRDTKIAEALVDKENAIQEAREKGQHNELVASLNQTIVDLKDELHELRIKQSTEIKAAIENMENQLHLKEEELRSERTKNVDQAKNYTEVIKNLNEEIKRSNTEFSEEVRKNMEQQEKMSEEIKTAKAQVRSLDQQHYNREDERMAIIQRYEQEAEERNRKTDFIIDRLRNRKTKLVDYSEGQILEIEENGEMVFYDLAKNKFYNFDDLYQLYNSYPTFEIDDFYIIDQAIEKFKNRK